MKNILIPTDFSLESFKLIDCLINEPQAPKMNIVFVHGFKLSGDIGDMLMLGRRSRDLERISDAFYATIRSYQQTYSDLIGEIRIEYFYGNTTVAFRNFLDAQQIDVVAYDDKITFTPINKYSINPQVLIDRANCDILRFDSETVAPQKNKERQHVEEFTNETYVFV